MKESEIDEAIAGLVKLRVTSSDQAIITAIKVLKNYRKERNEWRSLSTQLKSLRQLQHLNIDLVDRLRKAIFGR